MEDTSWNLNSSWNLCYLLLDCPTMRVTYLWGPPGIGKTYGAYTKGLEGRALYAITLTEDTPAAELRGHYIPKGGEFVWHDGPAVSAMRVGGRLVINEVSHASADVLSILFAVCESPETARITLPTGETVRPAKGFQVILTDNCSPQELPQALQDRMDAKVLLDTPAPEAIAAFPQALQSIVLKAATPKDGRRVSLRAWESFDRLMSGGMSMDNAGTAVFGEGYSALATSLRVAIAEKPEDVAEKPEDSASPVPTSEA